MTNNSDHAEVKEAITLEAALYRVTTTVDGGWNITFQAGQDQAQQILKLSNLRGSQLQFAIVPIN